MNQSSNHNIHNVADTKTTRRSQRLLKQKQNENNTKTGRK